MLSEKGSALILTILVLMVVMILGSGLVMTSISNSRQATEQVYDLQAYYIARSGADAVAQSIVDDPSRLESLKGAVSAATPLGKGHFTVEVQDRGDHIKLISTGVVKDTKRVVELTLLPQEAAPSPLPRIDKAIFATTNGGTSHKAIDLGGNAQIMGSGATNAVRANAVELTGNAVIKGNLWIGPGADAKTVVNDRSRITGAITSLEEEVTYPLPLFPEFPSWTKPSTPAKSGSDFIINSDGDYGTISLSGNDKLVIDLGGGERRIRVKSLTMRGNAELTVTNAGRDGKLFLYVDQEFSMSGNSALKSGADPNTVVIYYAGTKELGNQLEANCILIVKEADIKLTGNSTFKGSIFSGGRNVELAGNAEVKLGLLYAPRAAVDMAGNSETEAMVAWRVTASGNAKIVYKGDLTEFASRYVQGGSPSDQLTWTRGQWASVE
jgi:hypothetical protein